MEFDQVANLFLFLGFFAILGGLTTGAYFGLFLFVLGVSWFIAGFALIFARREVTKSGFLFALVLGVIGVILWLKVEKP
jgi:hypothetical protein